ncbi:MAG: ammonium transporter [Lentisphaeria bacterium]|nr:ammonium transporter [Lentisphaeria bacterium]NQZ70565.1 ammonium transporter [Lentisphaeria bacterium]
MEAQPLNTMWILICACLVFFMQAGFCCLESGLVRSKNSINVAAKNLIDLCFSSLFFILIGLGIFASSGSAIGFTIIDYASLSSHQIAVLFFQLVFCTTAVTIISGAVAERLKLNAFILVAIITAAFIYPLPAKWAWNSILNPENLGFLESIGFKDFAGSTVVHSVGGWVALALLLIIGPRYKRFEKDIEGHNLPLVSLGVIILCFGWFGFNGGSTLAFNDKVPAILLNTLAGAIAGGVASVICSMIKYKKIRIVYLFNGILAGLVSITASCNAISVYTAMLIAAIGSVIAFIGSHLLIKHRIDDAVDAIPIHCFAGVWGTLALALFADYQTLGIENNMFKQFGIQLFGVIAVAAISFLPTLCIFYFINKKFPIRASLKDEITGLNVAEHDAHTELRDLLIELEEHRLLGTFDKHIYVDPHTEVGHIAAQYNKILDKFNEMKQQFDMSVQSKNYFMESMSHELRTPLDEIISKAKYLMESDTENTTENIEQLLESANDISDKINCLHSLSQLSNQEFSINIEEVDIKDIIKKLKKKYQPLAAQKRLKFNIISDSNIPMIQTDAYVLYSILDNLLSNALKYTEFGSFSMHVLVDQELEFKVIDTGIGIDDEKAEHLLDCFTQAHGTADKNKYQGVGFGLNVASQFAEMIQGDLYLDNQVETGSVFTLLIPYGNSLDNDDPDEIKMLNKEKVKSTSTQGTLIETEALDPESIIESDYHILIAEDNKIGQKVAKSMVEKMGMNVDIAENGEVVLEKLRAKDYDLIFMDCLMPKLDGFQTSSQIRRNEDKNTHIPIIALTANTSDEDRDKCTKSGMDDFIGKPLKKEDVSKALNKWVLADREDT